MCWCDGMAFELTFVFRLCLVMVGCCYVWLFVWIAGFVCCVLTVWVVVCG